MERDHARERPARDLALFPGDAAQDGSAVPGITTSVEPASLMEKKPSASSLYVVGGGEENNAATRAKHSFEQNAIAIGSAATVIGNRYNNEQNVDSPVH
jgi:hypothetical protein